MACIRLQSIARDTFKYSHTTKLIDLDKSIYQKGVQRYQPHNLVNILRNFGDMITRLSIAFNAGVIYSPRPWKSNTKLFQLMIRYCTAPLQTLRLKYCRYLVRKKIAGAESLFRELKELEFFDCDGKCDGFSEYAGQINKLTIVYGPFEQHLRRRYPHLESFTLKLILDDPRSSMEQLVLEQFLRHHTAKLSEINLFGVERMDYSIIANMNQLTSLSVDEFYCQIEECNIMPLAQLRHLTSLTLSPNPQTTPLLQKLATTESLLVELSLTFGVWGDAPATLKTISRFKNLKKLLLELDRDCAVKDEHLIHLHGLNGLRELTLQRPRDVTAKGLADLVRHLPRLQKIKWNKFEEYFEVTESINGYVAKIWGSRSDPINIVLLTESHLQMNSTLFGDFVEYLNLIYLGTYRNCKDAICTRMGSNKAYLLEHEKMIARIASQSPW